MTVKNGRENYTCSERSKFMEKIKDYMLEPIYLILSEIYIFEKNEIYFFCFFPENE